MRIYFADFHARGCVAEAFVNGGPIATSRNGFIRNRIQVTHWIVDGINTVSATVRTLMQDSGDDLPLLSLRLCRGTERSLTQDDEFELLAEVTVTQPPVDRPAPFEMTATCSIYSEFRRWLWQDASVLTPSVAVEQEAAQFLREVHGAVERRDLDALETIVAVTFEEVAPAYDYAENVARAEFRKSYDKIFGSKSFGVRPLKPDEYRFRYCCGNRLIELCDKDSTALIRSHTFDQSGGWFLPLFIGWQAGQWKALR